MTSLASEKTQSFHYPERTIKRAELALRCLPFQLTLYKVMRLTSVSLLAIATQKGIEQGYTKSPLSELAAERDLLWLIQVGVLRREVDGQGITDSFRLTPLGRQLVKKWASRGESLPPPSLWDRIAHAWNRWLRLPI
ncbi:Npun_F0494 family protein [Coleofasciculus sp. E2-BRE-01]|uniref:Npun_F0494 family protein n=1 Tax=Coleofasciculus sp. E2-BRE-01 TaxID=3069524 RepID=UPI0032F6A7E3